jgi:diguanylate cyclase (GGDEF)-like protein
MTDLDFRVRKDKLTLLYRQSFPSLFVSILVGALLARILWLNHPGGGAGFWFAAVAAISLIRLRLFLVFRQTLQRDVEVLVWERHYFVSLLVCSAVWGLGTLWIVPKDSLFYQVVVFYFLMGMAGGAMAVYSASRGLTLATIFVVLGPFTLWMLAQGSPVQLAMGGAAAIFLASAVRSTRVISRALHQSFTLTHQLVSAKNNAEDMARTDALTGLMNRRAFADVGKRLFGVAVRVRQPISLIVIDLDHFKEVNDSHGHRLGDLVLQHVAQLLRESVRESDLCARLGGEEFAVLLPNTTRDSGLLIAEKLRQRIATDPVSNGERAYPVTASFGVAEGGETLDALIQQADEAMYRAKRGGRNRVAV